MIRRTSSLLYIEKEKIKVAILGSGLTGCTVASTLLESPEGKFDITLFEAGRNVGGRMSTRRYIDTNTGRQLSQFDHGCQVIQPPKTETFRKEFRKWEERGWVKPWEGRFGEISCASTSTPRDTTATGTTTNNKNNNNDGDESTSSNNSKFIYDELNTTTYVGHPRMSSICENLLQLESTNSTIQTFTKTRASATHLPFFREDPKYTWKIDTNTRTGKKILGEYDWLVVTDRNTFKKTNPDLVVANVELLATQVNRRMESIPSMVTMVKFARPLVGLEVDGLQLDYYSDTKVMKDNFGSLGWIARDSSKPGRRREIYGDEEDDGAECWQLQANRRESKRLLNRRELRGASMERIQKAIRETMVDDFLRAIPKLASITSKGENNNDEDSEVEIPPIVQATSHRWNSAFPIHLLSRKAYKNAFLDAKEGRECHVELAKHFIACGDYFGEHHGTVEGAFLSGRAAADNLIQEAIRWGYD